MSKEALSTLAKIGATAFVLYEASTLALNNKQRVAIRETRDGGKCQDTNDKIKHGGKLEVDHLLPQRFAREALGMLEEEYDVPENLLTRCVNHHRGHPDSHHPDANEALWNYRQGDKDSFKKMVDARNQRIQEKKLCWNNQGDAQARRQARLLTKQADKKHGLGWWIWSRWSKPVVK